MTKFSLHSLIFIFCIYGLSTQAQPLPDEEYLEYSKSSFGLLKELLSIPNDAHFPEDIEENVKWCEDQFSKRNFKIKRLETPAAPLLLAEKRSTKVGAKTVLFYLQVDGQPVDPSFWLQESPYKATLKRETLDSGWVSMPWEKLYEQDPDPDWRIFGRSTADSKGAVIMFLTATDMMLDKDIESDFHTKVIMDFEEEIGSPNLPAAVNQYQNDLSADMLVIFDGPMHFSGEPTLTFGARGITTLTLTVYGPNFPQHSGHYGNWAPNPAVSLAQLIASMKDEGQRVTIPGFYDGITLSDEIKAELKAVPEDERKINYTLGIAEPQKVAATYQESLQFPSLNVRGFSSGWVGQEVRTIVPATAIAEIDIRLVLESDPDRLVDLVKKHISSQGFYITDKDPNPKERLEHPRICKFEYKTSYLAFRTEFDSEIGIWLEKALKTSFGKPPLKIRTSGGSIPISPFVTELGIPAVTVPTVQKDNNQHSPNENIRLGNYIDGIRTIFGVLAFRW